MKIYGEVNVQKQVFLTLALVVGEWSTLRSGCFTSGKIPQYPLDRRRVVPIILMDEMK
jgi:hypothetical protein